MNKQTLDCAWKNIINFNNMFFPGWRNKKEIYYSHALAGEVGEVCNAVKHRCGGGTNISQVSDDQLMERG